MPVAVDTLKIYNRLRDAHLDEIAAREITEVFREITENNLSTKADLEKTKIELKTELEKVRAGLKADIEKVRAELKADIEKVRIELETKIEKTKAEVIKWIAGMLVAQAAIVATLIKLLS